jgi:hypothetical protein
MKKHKYRTDKNKTPEPNPVITEKNATETKNLHKDINGGIVNILNSQGESIGTGFFVSYDSFIVTSYHLLKAKGYPKIPTTVYFKYKGEIHKALCGIFSIDNDIAFLFSDKVNPDSIFSLTGKSVTTGSFSVISYDNGQYTAIKKCISFVNENKTNIDVSKEFCGSPIISEQSSSFVGMVGLIGNSVSKVNADKIHEEIINNNLILQTKKNITFTLPMEFVDSVFDIADSTERKKHSDINEEFANCLRNRKLVSKFLFFGDEVAKKHLQLMDSKKDYPLFKISMDHLNENIDVIIQKVLSSGKDIRLISLGIGNGQKDEIILSKILEKIHNDESIEYFIFDISSPMLRKGLGHIKFNLDDDVSRILIKVFPVDFEDIDSILKEENIGDKQNLFVLLGNTLGNFQETTLLKKIYKSMVNGDFLLIDNQLFTSTMLSGTNKLSVVNEEKLIHPYESKRDDEICYAVLNRAGLGSNDCVKTSDGKDFTVTLESSQSQIKQGAIEIIKTFTPNIDTTSILGKPVNFYNQPIELYRSRKYTEDGLIKIIEKAKLTYVENYGDENYALMLAEKNS